MYYAEDNKIYVQQLDINELNELRDTRELFLTVHKTTATMTPEQQASVLVNILNGNEKFAKASLDDWRAAPTTHHTLEAVPLTVNKPGLPKL